MTQMALPYNRALHPEDYHHPDLAFAISSLRDWEASLRQRGVPFRKDHEHREWEYGNVLRQLRELYHPPQYRGEDEPDILVLDTGFGGNYFTPMLAKLGYAVEAADSMAYGDCSALLISQCVAFDLVVPLHTSPVESMPQIPDETFDVTLCISTIEHVDASLWDRAWEELRRVTKIGGYVMVTTDYFRSLSDWDRSPYQSIQHTPVTEEFLSEHLALHPTLIEVGGLDLGYRGDFVHNYSFVNLCLQRRT